MTLAGIGVVVVGLIVLIVLNRDSSNGTLSQTTSDNVATTTTNDEDEPAPVDADATACPAENGSSPRTIDFAGPQPMCIDPGDTHVAIFDTSEGEIRVTLDTQNTPGTVNNFVTLARWGYYDGTTIHRTDPSIDIIQGGSPHTENAADPGPGYTILDEPQFEQDAAGNLTGPYRYVPGQLVMARSRGTNSGSAQYSSPPAPTQHSSTGRASMSSSETPTTTVSVCSNRSSDSTNLAANSVVRPPGRSRSTRS